MSWADGPLTVFDLETTGINTETARVVTACVARVMCAPGFVLKVLVNPGIEIPAEAVAVHGVTTERAIAEGSLPVETLPVLRDALGQSWADGVPVVIYNAPYDLTVLDRDLRRHGLGGLTSVGPVIDPLVLDRWLDPRRRGSRKLTDTCRHYDVRLDDAHEASADALAAGRVAWRIAKRYPAVADMSLDRLQYIQVAAHRKWAAGLQEYYARRGVNKPVDPVWPIRHQPADAPATSR